MKLFLNNACGLGDCLCTISLLASVPESIMLFANNDMQTYEKLKILTEILCVPDKKLRILHTNRIGNFGGNHYLNIVGKYYRADQIRVFGKKFKTRNYSKRKKYIGLSCYKDLDTYIDQSNHCIKDGKNNTGPVKSLPDGRYRPLPYYAELFKIIRSWGYDIITLDGTENNFELKILNLVENCEAVIGYEGGMGHLCSVLGIPYFMLDWQNDIPRPWGEFQLEMIHQSSTMYFVQDDEFFLKSNPDEIEKIIKDLQHGKTNNRIVNKEVVLQFKNGPSSRLTFLDQKGNILFNSNDGACITESAANFIKKYFPEMFSNKLE